MNTDAMLELLERSSGLESTKIDDIDARDLTPLLEKLGNLF